MEVLTSSENIEMVKFGHGISYSGPSNTWVILHLFRGLEFERQWTEYHGWKTCWGLKFGGLECTEGNQGLINCRPSLCILKMDLINYIYPWNSTWNITQPHFLVVCLVKLAFKRFKKSIRLLMHLCVPYGTPKSHKQYWKTSNIILYATVNSL